MYCKCIPRNRDTITLALATKPKPVKPHGLMSERIDVPRQGIPQDPQSGAHRLSDRSAMYMMVCRHSLGSGDFNYLIQIFKTLQWVLTIIFTEGQESGGTKKVHVLRAVVIVKAGHFISHRMPHIPTNNHWITYQTISIRRAVVLKPNWC